MKNYYYYPEQCAFKAPTHSRRRGTLLKTLLSFFLLLLVSMSVSAQSNEVTGVVTDHNGEALPGVNVIIKGTTDGIMTNLEGEYSLSVSPTDTIEISFIGYEKQIIPVGGKSLINITLLEQALDVDELVVVGYGFQKKSVVTAAISSLEPKELESVSNGRVESALQGKVAGISVLPTSGAPGASTKIRIRGTGSNGDCNPLYIVDGMKTKNIDMLNPNDIASMEVLKDAASAAIYGTEGANGVIIITTKSGKSGKAKVNYDFQYGIQNLSTNAEVMNAAQYKQYMEEAGKTITVPSGEKYDTDWLDEISESAPMQRHSLSVAGGNEKSTYMISGSYLKQDGAIGGSNTRYERYTFRANGTHQAKDWLEVGSNISFAHSKRKATLEDDEYRSIVNSALLMDPYTPVLESDQSRINAVEAAGNTVLRNSKGQAYGFNRFVTGEIANPVAFLENTHDTYTVDNLLASFYGTITPLEGLSITSRGGIDLTYETEHAWTPKYYFSSERSNSTNTINDYIDKYYTVLWENFASYNKQVGDHNFTGLVGMSYEDLEHPNYTLQSDMAKEGDTYAYHDFSPSLTTQRVGGTLVGNTKISYFGRISYDYANKYMLQASIRRDGSSCLPDGNKWGTFSAVSGGWVISEESFFDVEPISFLKLRASWGQNGSISNVIDYADRALWTSEGIMVVDDNQNTHAGSIVEKITNPDLAWEKSVQTDIGLDLRMFDSRFSFSVDYYKKVTDGLIAKAPLPGSPGSYDLPSANIGEVENSGFEFEASYRGTLFDGLEYQVGANLSTLHNEVTSVSNGGTNVAGKYVRGNYLTYFAEGEPIWYFQGYNITGIDPATGDPIVEDVSGDGVIDANDLTNIGDPHPDFLYGGNISLTYKGFDFNMFLQGTHGNDIFMAWFRTDREYSNKPTFFYEDRWQKAGDNSSMPKADNTSDYIYRSSLVCKDGSYMRIKQIQLGYTLPNDFTSRWGIERVRGFVSLDDYFTFTKYEGMDPEAGSTDNDSQGIDKGLYPTTKKIMFGVNVSF